MTDQDQTQPVENNESAVTPVHKSGEAYKNETPPEPQVVTAEPVSTPAPDPGNSAPENWTEPLSEEDQQEARDRAASEEEARPKTLAELDAEYVADGNLEDLSDRERHARVEAVRAAQHEQSRRRDVDPNAPTQTSSPLSRGEASVEFQSPES